MDHWLTAQLIADVREMREDEHFALLIAPVKNAERTREKIREAVPLSVPAAARLLRSHNRDRSGLVGFGEFARAMSALSPRATLEEKVQ